MGYIRIAFFLQLMVSASTYFLAYKRTLLYADQKQYVCSLVDIVCNVGFAVIKFGIIIGTGNYYAYLVAQIIQNVISNLIVHVICKKQYEELNEYVEVGAKLKKNLFSDVKNVFTSKLATYVYGSTDNLVISSLISTVSVGYLSSYKYITSCLMSIVYYMMIPIQPMIGNYLVDESLERSKNLFRNYTFVRYFLAMILLVPAICLADTFIAIWIGGEFTMNPMITYLLVADTYISIVYGPTGEYINARGLFEKEKKIMILAAVMNIVLSVAGTFVIGIYGVLLGTVVCQVILWIGKSSIVFKHIFHMERKEYAGYWLEQGKGLLLFCLTAWAGKLFTACVLPEAGIVSFVVKGAVLVVFCFLVLTVFYGRLPDMDM
ncbi:MAG: oligosaccharide flippase family protein [Lachnospiraceae bacterium]